VSGRIAVYGVDHPLGDEADLVGGLDVRAVAAAGTREQLEACVRGQPVHVGNDHRWSSRPGTSDFAWLDWEPAPGFVMRSRVMKRLGKALEGCGFVVELENADAAPLWLFRAAREGVAWLEPAGFDPAEIRGTRVFTMAGSPDGPLHATQGFVDAVTAARFTGIRFEEILREPRRGE